MGAFRAGWMAWLLLASCGKKDDDDGGDACDPDAGDECACDPDEPDTCPAGYVCRPAEDGAVCEPEGAAGRIPSCTDPDGLDVFAAEANQALSVSWKVNGDLDHAGGFDVLFGRAPGSYDESLTVAAEVRQATLRPLENDLPWHVAVETLDASGSPTFRSCEIVAVPHVLVFRGDLVVHDDTDGDERDPDLASNLDGSRLYLAYEDDGEIVLAVSEDFGDRWAVREAPVASGARASIAVRDAILDDAGAVVIPEAAFVAWEEGGQIRVALYDPVGNVVGEPETVDAGTAPDLLVVGDVVHLAFEQDDGIAYTSGDGLEFEPIRRLESGLVQAGAPSVAASAPGDAWVAFDAIDGAGDSNAYVSAADAASAVRIDDDPQGQNQLEVSLAHDPTTGFLYAAWEDRRGGANVFFSLSQDAGATWAANVDVGAGLGGDQFRPEAVVDVASNVYVAFHDATDGQKVVFSRFNEEGTFDPPLIPGSVAGQAGVVGDDPSVATDRYGAVYLAWEENRDGADTDIVFARAE